MNIKLDIPEEFFRGEERCGYYVSPEMKRVWAVELDLIAEFARICEKYNLKWYADGGTLLGAARHKGFIPWDDDVDLIMMRKDYERLCEVAAQEFSYPYVFYDFWHEAKRLISHSKLYNADTTLLDVGTKLFITHGGKNIKYPQGIFIDIFVLEDIPDDEHEFSRMMRRASLLRRISRFLYRMSEENYCTAYTVWKRPFKYTAFCILKLMNRCGIRLPSYKKFFHKFVDVISSYNNPESIRIANLTFVNDDFLGGERVIQKRAHYKDTAYLPFEMLTLPVPACYEDALNQLYGKDWHVFKITHNHGTFFDTERPYTYYLEEGHHFEFREFNAHL